LFGGKCPLIAGGSIIGALNVASSRRIAVPDQQREILLAIGRELGVALNG
jgi:hypothetical protein